MLLLRDKPQQ